MAPAPRSTVENRRPPPPRHFLRDPDQAAVRKALQQGKSLEEVQQVLVARGVTPAAAAAYLEHSGQKLDELVKKGPKSTPPPEELEEDGGDEPEAPPPAPKAKPPKAKAAPRK